MNPVCRITLALVPPRFIAGRLRALNIGLFCLGLVGCGLDVGSFDPVVPATDGNRDDTVTDPPGKNSGEPNDAFTDALVAVFDANGVAGLQGTIEAVGDLDVFSLGALSPGAQIIVDANTSGSPLDVSVALFDDQQRLVYANDDREGSGTRFLDSFVEFIVRHGGDDYFLVVTHSAFSSSGQNIGGYRVDVQISAGFAVPPPVGQILLLDFDGAVIDSPELGTMTLEPFDAADIARAYTGQTETIKQTIIAVMEQDYERFNVTVVTTDDPPLPEKTEFSTVHFGGINIGAFGISESVDLYNIDFCDDAIIFTESFSPRIFGTAPSAAELGVAIGNVASHEAGHLLGLNHVQDDQALMDDQSPPAALLVDQEFLSAPLSRDIMRIGIQDPVLLLYETVGPNPADPSTFARTPSTIRSRRYWNP